MKTRERLSQSDGLYNKVLSQMDSHLSDGSDALSFMHFVWKYGGGMGSTFVTGLDWSGDPGDPKKTPHNSPFWVFSAVTIAIDQIGYLKESLNNARAELRIDPDYTFKHIHAYAAYA